MKKDYRVYVVKTTLQEYSVEAENEYDAKNDLTLHRTILMESDLHESTISAELRNGGD
jgi:hypothetical protein|tara:strand:- start:2026 stop:2199 length:174 start_codon:yes stop_codon:yes gene_type:complete